MTSLVLRKFCLNQRLCFIGLVKNVFYIWSSLHRATDVGLLRLQVQRGLELHPAAGAEAVLRLGAEARLRLQQHVHEALRPVEGVDAEVPQNSQPGR